MKGIHYIIILTGLFAIGCRTSTDEKMTESLRIDLDALKAKHAPDTRTKAWLVEIEETKDTIRLTADIESEDAKNELNKLLAEKYPRIVHKINLLPENEPERLVHAIINNSVASIRGEPKHKAEMVSQAFLGTPVRVLKKKAGWYLAQTPNKYLGWINADDLVFFEEEKLNVFKQQEKVIYNRQSGSSHINPDTESQVVSDLVIGCILTKVGKKGNFIHVAYPDGRTAYVHKDEVIDMMAVFNRMPDKEKLVATAMRFHGIPYLWGGFSSKAIDCSGFTSTVYFMNGIVLQRDASQQIRYGKLVSEQYTHENLMAGDLLFFGRRANDSLPEKVTHVAMYIGDTEFIHASGKVKVNSIDSTRTNYIKSYKNLFIRTMRVIGSEGTESIDRIIENDFYKNIIPSNK
jgi:gamma-D-glutamyl-L-lysine dipeptidyl-peptidase